MRQTFGYFPSYSPFLNIDIMIAERGGCEFYLAAKYSVKSGKRHNLAHLFDCYFKCSDFVKIKTVAEITSCFHLEGGSFHIAY